MKKVFSIIGILFSVFVIYVGGQFLNGSDITAPSSASSAPAYYDSGYATFGADFYSFVTNNAAETASASRTIASNQIYLFRLMSRFFGYLLISFGGMGVCLFSILGFDKKPTSSNDSSGAVSVQANQHESRDISSRSAKDEVDEAEKEYKRSDTFPLSEKFICTECGNKFSGWYQTCPNCGAIGKMKKNDTSAE